MQLGRSLPKNVFVPVNAAQKKKSRDPTVTTAAGRKHKESALGSEAKVYRAMIATKPNEKSPAPNRTEKDNPKT